MTHHYIALCLGYLALFGIGLLTLGTAIFALLAAGGAFADGHFTYWRQPRAGRPDHAVAADGTASPKPWEYSMKRRITLVACLVAAFACLSLAGCASWFDGDGGDVSVVWTSDLGHEFTLVAGQDGIDGVLYKSAATGILYQITQEGGFVITAPSGETQRIKPTEAVPPDIGTNPEANAALRHVHEAVG